METIDQLIHARWVITCEGEAKILENYSIAIREKIIHDILPIAEAKVKYTAEVSQSFTSHVVMPGLINSHTHCAMSLLRGLADDLELMDWLTNHIWPAETKWVSDEMVFDGTQLAIAEMIRSGTTCFNDMYFFLEATAKAATAAQIRAHIGMTIIDVPTAWAQTIDEYFAKAEDFYHQYKNNALITPTLAPHSTYTVKLDELARVKKLADQYQLKTNIHLQEAPSEIQQSMDLHGKRPLQRLAEIDMVNKDLIAVHMTQINSDDLELLIKHKPSLVHCPESNMKLVSGGCPVDQLKGHNINVALGTDGAASNNDLDMWGEMRTAAFYGKVIANNPKAVAAYDVIKMATINGAKALGIDHMTGSLAIGKQADMIAVNLENLSTVPVYNPISHLVYAVSRQQVTDVWVSGKQLMNNRELLTIDEKEIINKAHHWRKKIKS